MNVTQEYHAICAGGIFFCLIHLCVASLHLINKLKPLIWFVSVCLHIFTLPWFLVATFYRSRNSGRSCASLDFVMIDQNDTIPSNDTQKNDTILPDLLIDDLI